jgi:hypothetical protein
MKGQVQEPVQQKAYGKRDQYADQEQPGQITLFIEKNIEHGQGQEVSIGLYGLPGKFLEECNVLVMIDARYPAGYDPGGIGKVPQVSVLGPVFGLDVFLEYKLADGKYKIEYEQIQYNETDPQHCS